MKTHTFELSAGYSALSTNKILKHESTACVIEVELYLTHCEAQYFTSLMTMYISREFHLY